MSEDELQSVYGGWSVWGSIKKAAKWVKDHVVIGLNKIGIKGKF